MPVMPALFIELLTPLPTLGLLDAAKVLGVPVALYLLTRFVNRRDKVRDETASEEKHALRTHNESFNWTLWN